MLLPLLLYLLAPGPKELDFTSQWVTDADLAAVARNAELRKLDLSQTKITDAGLEYLKDLPNVRELHLYYAEHFTADGLAHLKGWKHLEVLNLRGARVTSKAFEHIAHLTNLRELDLAYSQIDDSGFDQLASLEKLEKLSIGGNRLTGSSLSILKSLPALRSLDAGGIQRVDSGLWGLPLSDENLARLGELSHLRWLSLSGATINDRGTDRPGHPEAERSQLRDLSALRRLVNLEFLDLSRQPLSPEAVRSLEGMTSLRELRLGLVRNIEVGNVPPLPALRKIYINGSWVSR